MTFIHDLPLIKEQLFRNFIVLSPEHYGMMVTQQLQILCRWQSQVDHNSTLYPATLCSHGLKSNNVLYNPVHNGPSQDAREWRAKTEGVVHQCLHTSCLVP